MDRIDALRLFVRLSEHGSFSAAARELKIKQSTASKWVAELEQQLGTSLVQRTTRSLQITDAGRRLLARALPVITAFEELTGEFEARDPEPRGRLRVSAPVVFGRMFVAPALAEFLLRYPQVCAELSFNDRYVNLVDEGFDLAVRVGIVADTSARGRKLAEGRRVLVASPAYLKAHGWPRVPKDLKHHECLIHADANTNTIWRFGRELGADLPVPVRGRVAANNSEAVLVMVRSGLGIGLLADWLVGEDLEHRRLVPLLEQFPAPPAPIHVLSPPGRFASAAARALTEHLGAVFAARLPAKAKR